MQLPLHRPLRRLFHKLLHCWVLARRLPTEQQFLEGEAINYSGLLFVLDSRDDSLIHIAIPLDGFDPSEIPEMVREARELFVDFIRERPSLEKLAERRALQIRVVASYDRFDEEIGQRIRVDRWFDDRGADWPGREGISSRAGENAIGRALLPVGKSELGCQPKQIRRESN